MSIDFLRTQAAMALRLALECRNRIIAARLKLTAAEFLEQATDQEMNQDPPERR